MSTSAHHQHTVTLVGLSTDHLLCTATPSHSLTVLYVLSLTLAICVVEGEWLT